MSDDEPCPSKVSFRGFRSVSWPFAARTSGGANWETARLAKRRQKSVFKSNIVERCGKGEAAWGCGDLGGAFMDGRDRRCCTCESHRRPSIMHRGLTAPARIQTIDGFHRSSSVSYSSQARHALPSPACRTRGGLIRMALSSTPCRQGEAAGALSVSSLPSDFPPW